MKPEAIKRAAKLLDKLKDLEILESDTAGYSNWLKLSGPRSDTLHYVEERHRKFIFDHLRQCYSAELRLFGVELLP